MDKFIKCTYYLLFCGRICVDKLSSDNLAGVHTRIGYLNGPTPPDSTTGPLDIGTSQKFLYWWSKLDLNIYLYYLLIKYILGIYDNLE